MNLTKILSDLVLFIESEKQELTNQIGLTDPVYRKIDGSFFEVSDEELERYKKLAKKGGVDIATPFSVYYNY